MALTTYLSRHHDYVAYYVSRRAYPLVISARSLALALARDPARSLTAASPLVREKEDSPFPSVSGFCDPPGTASVGLRRAQRTLFAREASLPPFPLSPHARDARVYLTQQHLPRGAMSQPLATSWTQHESTHCTTGPTPPSSLPPPPPPGTTTGTLLR